MIKCLLIFFLLNPFSILIAQQEHKDISSKIIQYENGFKLILFHNPTFKNTSMKLSVNTGYYRDPEKYIGLAHLLEHTYNHSGKYVDLISELNKSGSYLSAETKGTFTTFNINGAKDNIDQMLQHTAAFLINPNFEENKIAQDLKIIESEKELRSKSNINILVTALKKTLPENHPYQNYNADSLPAQLKNDLTPLIQELKEFHKINYTPNNTSLFIATNIPLDIIQVRIEKIFKKYISLKQENIQKDKYSRDKKDLLFNRNNQDKILSISGFSNYPAFAIIIPFDYEYNRTSSAAIDYYLKNLNRKNNGSLFKALFDIGLIRDIKADKISFDGVQNNIFIEFKLNNSKDMGLDRIKDILIEYFTFLSNNANAYQEISANEITRENYISSINDSASLINFISEESSAHSNVLKNELSLFTELEANDILETSKIIENFRPCLNTNCLSMKLNIDKKINSNNSNLPLTNMGFSFTERTIPDTSQMFIDQLVEGNDIRPTLVYNTKNISIWNKRFSDTKKNSFTGVNILFYIADLIPDEEYSAFLTVLNSILKQKLFDLDESVKSYGGNLESQVNDRLGITLNVFSNCDTVHPFIRELSSALDDIYKNDISRSKFESIVSQEGFKLEENKLDLMTYDTASTIRGHIRSYSSSNLTKNELANFTYNDFNRLLKKYPIKHIDFYISNGDSNFNYEAINEKISFHFKRLNIQTLDESKNSDEKISLWPKIPVGSKLIHSTESFENLNWCILNYQFPDFELNTRVKSYIIRSYLSDRFLNYIRKQNNPDYFSEITSLDNGIQFTLFSGTKTSFEMVQTIKGFITDAFNEFGRLDAYLSKKQYTKRANWYMALTFQEINKLYWKDIVYPVFYTGDKESLSKITQKLTYTELKEYYKDLLLNKDKIRLLIISNDPIDKTYME
jgi:secreted Zn-dependent insulinase-like peptidase